MIATLTGSNSYLLQQRLRQLVSDFVAKHGDMGIERVRAGETEYQRITEVLSALPFLVDRRLVVIDQPSNNKLLASNIELALSMVNDQTDVILVEPKFDKRSVIYKFLKQHTDWQELNELEGSRLIGWLSGYAKEQGGELNNAEANYLIQRAGSDQVRLKNEIEKLISYQPKVSRQNIDLLVSANPTSSTFDLLDATLNGNSQRAVALYAEQRLQKVEPQAILALLAWQLHVLATIKAAGDKAPNEIAQDAKLNPFVVRKSVNLARRLSATTLKEIVDSTLRLDMQLKRESIDPDDAMQNLLLAIAQQHG